MISPPSAPAEGDSDQRNDIVVDANQDSRPLFIEVRCLSLLEPCPLLARAQGRNLIGRSVYLRPRMNSISSRLTSAGLSCWVQWPIPAG